MATKKTTAKKPAQKLVFAKSVSGPFGLAYTVGSVVPDDLDPDLIDEMKAGGFVKEVD